MVDRAKILKGREAVDAYRVTHTQLYVNGWHKGIPEEHTLYWLSRPLYQRA